MMTMKIAVSVAAMILLMSTASFAQDGGRVDANGMPTTHSTPAERADPAQINNQIGVSNAAAGSKTATDSADYQAKQQQYQGQLQQNQAQQQDYQDHTAGHNGP
jgi:hypothetical protein